MANPVEFNRRHELRSMSLTIPLLGERNSYLVVRIPNEVAQEAVRLARELPDTERPAFLREWILRNQQAVLEAYARGGRSERRFRFDIVPATAARVGEATPRRIAEPNPPQRQAPEESPHRLIETRHFYDDGRDVAPPGWRAAPANAPIPQEVRVRANQFQPRRGAGQIPMGDGRIEEFGGRRYLYLACYHTIPAPRHPSVSVYVQAEPQAPPRVIQPDQAPERPVAGPRPRAEERQLPPFPSQIKGGNGSQARPYEVYLSRAEVDRAPASASQADTIVSVPLVLDIEGLGVMRFSVAFRGRQVTRTARGATQGELWQIIRQTADRVAAERGVRVESSAFRTAQTSYAQSFPRIMSQIEAADPDLGRYLSSN